MAVGVGGSLFGRTALEPSVRNISNRNERGEVINDAWRRFGAIQLASLGMMAATWLAGRLSLTGRRLNASARGLVVAKDVLVGASLASAIGAAVTGNKLAAQRESGGVARDDDGEVSIDSPDQIRRLGRLTDAFGLLNLIAGAGVIAVTTVLAMSAGRSARWSVRRRVLP